MKKGSAWSLLPIGVFIIVYLTLGVVFEYILNIPMGFYKVPIVVAFLIAILTACLQNKKRASKYEARCIALSSISILFVFRA